MHPVYFKNAIQWAKWMQCRRRMIKFSAVGNDSSAMLVVQIHFVFLIEQWRIVHRYWCATNSFELSLHCRLVVVNHCWFVADWVRDGIVGKWKKIMLAYSRRYIQVKYMNETICVSSCVRWCVRFSYSVNKCEYMSSYTWTWWVE